MQKDGKYRFNLQFGSSTNEEVNAGELLNKLGHRKSAVVVKALNDYLELHPELLDPTVKIRVDQRTHELDLTEIESKIREMVDQKIKNIDTEDHKPHESPVQTELVNDDILDMLGDLNLFR